MLPSKTTKVVPAAMMNSVELSASKPSCVEGARKLGCAISINTYSTMSARKGALSRSFAASGAFSCGMLTSDHVFDNFDLRGLTPNLARQDLFSAAVSHDHHAMAEPKN